MHRRQFLTMAGSVAGAGWVADPNQLADLVRHRAGSNVDEVDLDDLDLTVDYLTRQTPVASHHELFPLAARNWAMADGLLDGWQSLAQRRRLVELAGQLAYYVAWLHYCAGRYPQAWQFATLAQRYAAETGDRGLRHSAVLLHSSVASSGGNHRRALQVLERGGRHAADFTRAEGHACAARSYGALGDRDAALGSLRGMWSATATVDRPTQGVSLPFVEGSALLFTATCRQRLGDGPEAVTASRDAVAFLAPDGSRLGSLNHSRVTLALSLTAGDRPNPDEAAALGHFVLATPGPLRAALLERLVEFRDALHPWARDPQVALLSDEIGGREQPARA
jgi:hypothetical protein